MKGAPEKPATILLSYGASSIRTIPIPCTESLACRK
jgi:hypothetical protein